MSTLSNLRKLTVSSIYCKTIFKKPIVKPKITISGDWVQKAGFDIGDKIKISVTQNQLIITKF